MSEFNIDSIRKYIHVNKGKVEEEPNIPHQTNETLSDLESLKSIEMEARLSFSKVNGTVNAELSLLRRDLLAGYPLLSHWT